MEEVKFGVGHHTAAIFADPDLVASFSKVILTSWIHALFNLIAIFFVKISVGLFLIRLVEGTAYKVYLGPNPL